MVVLLQLLLFSNQVIDLIAYSCFERLLNFFVGLVFYLSLDVPFVMQTVLFFTVVAFSFREITATVALFLFIFRTNRLFNLGQSLLMSF